MKELYTQRRNPQTAHRFDHPNARKSRLKLLVTSQLIPKWYGMSCDVTGEFSAKVLAIE